MSGRTTSPPLAAAADWREHRRFPSHIPVSDAFVERARSIESAGEPSCLRHAVALRFEDELPGGPA